jgi:hypothetical protein
MEDIMDETKCTHDCSTCGSVCEEVTSLDKDIFTRMDDVSKALHDDTGFEMLEKLAAELDAEEERENG